MHSTHSHKWLSLPVACTWTVVLSGYSGFFQHQNWSPWYSWKWHYKPKINQSNQSNTISDKLALKCILNYSDTCILFSMRKMLETLIRKRSYNCIRILIKILWVILGTFACIHLQWFSLGSSWQWFLGVAIYSVSLSNVCYVYNSPFIHIWPII